MKFYKEEKSTSILCYLRETKRIDSSVDICTGLMEFLLCILKYELSEPPECCCWDNTQTAVEAA